MIPLLDAIFDSILLVIVLVVLFVVIVGGVVYYRIRYKVANIDQALVITGGKKPPLVLPGEGRFVAPNRKFAFFPLAVMTVRSDDQETQTKTLIPIVVKWTAQLRVDTETSGALEKAARGFSSYDSKDIINSLQQTLDGEVRAVVATMTPEAVVTDKVNFASQVTDGVAPRMEELGYKLVSLNISEVSDRNNHYSNLAAADREEQRRDAETLTAQANQQVAVETARSDRASREAGLDRDLAIDEKNREVKLRQSAIRIETDTADANAAIAGQLQTEVRNQELAARRGEVAVIEAQQEQAAATAQRESQLTRAETDKQRRAIEAAAEAEKARIDAEAAAAVAQARATGEAEAAKAKAQGEADALTATTTAKANEVRATGQAEADASRAKGEAEAAAILAKGEAEAEVQRKMAEALAANEGANLRVTLAEIQRDTTVKIYSTVGEAMARVGEHATFIDMGGSSNGGGDLLTSVLGNIPEMIKQLDVKSDALNGAPFGASIGAVLNGITNKSNPDVQVTPEASVAETIENDDAPSDTTSATPDESDAIVSVDIDNPDDHVEDEV